MVNSSLFVFDQGFNPNHDELGEMLEESEVE